jgi:hypothetical protein
VVVIARPIVFDENSPVPLYRHLDRWAAERLGSAEGWGSMVERCGQWVDYSPRNQVLLASYGVVGLVAGTATWERVPSSEGARPCAVRAGEHGLPIRVPVTGQGSMASPRSRLPARSRSVAAGHRWDLVYATEQLARRPAPGSLTPVAVPSLRPGEWNEVVRRATGRLTGRTPRRVVDADVQLVALAARAPLPVGRPRVAEPVLLSQAVWSVRSRVGLDAGPMPGFDPQSLSPRERWHTLVDVRAVTDRVLYAVSHSLGVDLTASPLPRVEASDDREVAATRRNYLSPADVRGLPLGVWVETGPYSRGEWLARGVAGASGRAAHLRVNDRSYLSVYEARSGALWRLETTGRGAHRGLVAEGGADGFEDAKQAVRAALRDRFPQVARGVDAGVGAPVAPQHGWVPLPGGRDVRTERRVFDERVSATIAPGPGGRWETWVAADGVLTQGPLVASAGDARELAEAMARGALMTLAADAPDRADRMVRDLVEAGTLSRADLDGMVGARLADVDRVALRSPVTPPDVLVDLLSATGVLGPATVVAVLHHEGVDAATTAGLIPAIGLPVVEGIRELHGRWGMDRLVAGGYLSATSEELRAAGCTTVEMLQAAPREVLRRLDTRDHTWQMAAVSLLDAGFSTGDAIGQLALHAPTPETFAAGVCEIEDGPLRAFPTAIREASVPDLVALSERYGLSPAETAATLVLSCASVDVVARVVHCRCDDDVVATVEACRGVLDPALTERALLDEPVVSEPARLDAENPDAGYVVLCEALGEPVDASATPGLSSVEGLTVALDAAVTGGFGPRVERDGRD